MSAAPAAAATPRAADGYDVDALREREFPWTLAGDVTYLNNASTGPLPERTVAAVGELTRLRAEPHRFTEELQFGTVDRSRELCARLIGASARNVALMPNTSHGINLAARVLPLDPGDVVLTFDREFPANVYPWLALERSRGARVELVPCTPDGLPDEDALVRRIERGGVRIVAVSWVSFVTGYRVDLARIGAACRAHGAWFVVDAMQGVGVAVLDAPALPIDLLAVGAQKWMLGPWGTGFAYVRDGLLDQLEPSVVGWLSVRGSDDFTRLTDYDLTYRDDARRFEVMTLPYQEFGGLNASAALLLELGIPAVEAHVGRLTGALVDWARGRDDVALVTPADPARRAGIVSLRPRDAAAASARLRAAGVAHSLREGCIRLAPHAYNTQREIERAIELLGG